MEKINHKERKHALLSASGAHRWIKCTPSARLEEKFELSHPSKSSSYAMEGTLAHELCELKLNLELGYIQKKEYNKEHKKITKKEFYDAEMETHTDDYVSFVMERVITYEKETGSKPEVYIEKRLDYSHIVEKGFGTGDLTIISENTVEVIDFKYGRGVLVEAKENPQLKLYGIGALRDFELLYDIKTVKLTIFQPRRMNISSWDISTKDLYKWAEEIVIPAAKKAYVGKGIKVAGEHCKFCKIKAICKTYADYNLELLKHDFEDPDLLSDDKLIGIFGAIPMLLDWAKSVEDYIKDRALEGKKWKGYKLVEGRSTRKWKDEEKVLEILRKLKGINKSQYLKSGIEGIPAIEKVLGKNKLPENLKAQIVKPQGKPILVPESDKRPAFGIEQAKKDFS